MSKTIKIGNREIGQGKPTYMIAEMSANHAGSIERAKEIIHAAKEAGADCVKIQTYTPDTLTIDCHNKWFDISEGTWKGENLYSLYGKAYTPLEWHAELYEESKKVGIDFFSTPFDSYTADFLEEIGMEFYKIASFEMIDLPFLRAVASKGKPMIVSTGMATIEEIKEAVNAIYETGNHELALLKCSSAYPAVSDQMNLSCIPDMIKRFDIPIGLSDHSMGHLGAVTAVAMGATIIEKHFCMDRKIENPDSSFSMTPDEYKEMVKNVRLVEKAKGEVSYGKSKQEESNIVFRRSLFAVEDIKCGEQLTTSNVRSIRPGYGMPPKYLDDVCSMTAGTDIKRGEPLTFDKVTKGGVLFLTNNPNTDVFYGKLKSIEPVCYHISEKITSDMIKDLAPKFVIAFNYKHIISEDVCNMLKDKIVNLHTSFLPFNKGACPNFFSFYDDTPKGVTIHRLEAGLDTGDIILQKEVEFDEDKETLRTSYDKLVGEMTDLFFANYDKILKSAIEPVPQKKGEGTYHKRKDFDAIMERCPFTYDEPISEIKRKLGR